MALTNAEKQARHRARRDAELMRLRGQIDALRAENERLRADLAALRRRKPIVERGEVTLAASNDDSGRRRCAGCGRSVDPFRRSRFCSAECRASDERHCAGCGGTLAGPGRFCSACRQRRLIARAVAAAASRNERSPAQ
jgi:hypothetical protein